jgi:hypothetical protein
MTPEELQQQELAHEEHIARLLEVRNRGKRSQWWDHAGLTALSATLITFAGSYILKSHEFAAQQRSAELTQMRREILDANVAIAGMLEANEERFLLARGKMAKLTPAERDEIRIGTNKLQKEWRQQRESAEMTVLLSFAGVPAVPGAWSNARSRIEVYTDCMEAAYDKFQYDTAPPTICETERAGALRTMAHLRSELVKAYTHALK